MHIRINPSPRMTREVKCRAGGWYSGCLHISELLQNVSPCSFPIHNLTAASRRGFLFYLWILNGCRCGLHKHLLEGLSVCDSPTHTVFIFNFSFQPSVLFISVFTVLTRGAGGVIVSWSERKFEKKLFFSHSHSFYLTLASSLTTLSWRPVTLQWCVFSCFVVTPSG